MRVQQGIEKQLLDGLAPVHLEVVNESGMHNVPPGSESHFRVTVVSEQFVGRRDVARHQLVYGLLRDALQSGVHALALHTYAPDEWRERAGAVPASPPCLGGSKRPA